MKNFAEEIAYLYFRLNGFFLIENYVTHNEEYDSNSHTDSDLLGIKTNLVFENVGLNSDAQIDSELFRLIKGYELIGLICEVKGGKSSDWSLGTTKLEACIKRLGLIDNMDGKEMEIAITKLKVNQDYTVLNTSKIIIKILASDNPNTKETYLWHHISLKHMVSFINERVKTFPVKANAWNFNNSNVFQYLMYTQSNTSKEVTATVKTTAK
jgi:hypothetical protein